MRKWAFACIKSFFSQALFKCILYFHKFECHFSIVWSYFMIAVHIDFTRIVAIQTLQNFLYTSTLLHSHGYIFLAILSLRCDSCSWCGASAWKGTRENIFPKCTLFNITSTYYFSDGHRCPSPKKKVLQKKTQRQSKLRHIVKHASYPLKHKRPRCRIAKSLHLTRYC